MKIFLPFSTLAILLAFLSFSQHEEKKPATFFQKAKVQSETDQAIVIHGAINEAILKTSNGCGIGNFLIPTAGNSNQGIPPTIGALSDNWPTDFKALDTLSGSTIKGVAFRRESWPGNTSVIYSGYGQSPYVIIADNGMFSYSIPEDFDPWSDELPMSGSMLIPDIIKAAKQITIEEPNPIVLYVKDSTDHYSLRFYSYPTLQEQFHFPFPFEPEIFEVTTDGLFITGLDTSGNYMLYHFSILEENLLASYPLNEQASNAQEFLKTEDALFILSAPGDSITMLSTINLADNTLSQTIIYPKSGARATYNDFKNNKQFTFQPISDLPDAILNKQILIFDPATHQLDTFIVNLELDYFKHPLEVPQSFGYFELQWVGAKWEGETSDTVYIKQDTDVFKITTGAFPQYVNATYGCWVGVAEQELEKIKFEYYPNPTTSSITINLSGLKKERAYKLDITDNSGKIHYTTKLGAYQKIQLPLEEFPKGIYFLKLDTGKNLITKKLVIQ